MSDEFADISTRTREWFEGAHETGWLDSAEFEQFNTLEHATPADLFTDQQARPLVVAFFGGTGVGKSSLLNRLAGSAIARTGVERPTSREITLYLHRDVKLADFPQALPLESVRVERHDQPKRRDFLWIDAPDIDSTEASNRECALAWLPHIDLLVYVVSPERYRDDTGWRVLLERGQRHGWMFIMNHWDEGDRTQRDDFTRMLRSAGFDDPLVLCTCCVDRGGVQDEFARVEAALQDLLAAHGVRELTRLGHRARLQELRRVLIEARERLGDEQSWNSVSASATSHWGKTVETVSDGLQWSMQSVAARLATREDGMLATLRQTAGVLRGDEKPKPESAKPGPDVGELSYLTESLWEQWADRKIADGVAAIENTTQKHGIGVRPVRERLEEVTRGARSEIMTCLQDELRGALGDPGSAFHRAARRVSGFLITALPLVVLAWVTMNLVIQYVDATRGEGPYPGGDFAVSSLMMVALAWLLPFLLDRWLRPSTERKVLRALRGGLTRGLELVGRRLGEALAEAIGEATAYRTTADHLVKQVAGLLVRPVRSDRPEIARFVAGKPTTTDE